MLDSPQWHSLASVASSRSASASIFGVNAVPSSAYSSRSLDPAIAGGPASTPARPAFSLERGRPAHAAALWFHTGKNTRFQATDLV